MTLSRGSACAQLPSEPLTRLSDALVKLGVALAAIRSTVTDDREFAALQRYVGQAIDAANELRGRR